MPHEQVSMYATDMHFVRTTCSGADDDFLVRQEDMSLSRRNINQFRFLSKKTGPTI